jgi:hypothetical protein
VNKTHTILVSDNEFSRFDGFLKTLQKWKGRVRQQILLYQKKMKQIQASTILIVFRTLKELLEELTCHAPGALIRLSLVSRPLARIVAGRFFGKAMNGVSKFDELIIYFV